MHQIHGNLAGQSNRCRSPGGCPYFDDGDTKGSGDDFLCDNDLCLTLELPNPPNIPLCRLLSKFPTINLFFATLIQIQPHTYHLDAPKLDEFHKEH